MHFNSINYKANSLGSSCRNCFSITIKSPYEETLNFQGFNMNTIDNGIESYVEKPSEVGFIWEKDSP